ncbi:MAG: hypothetical protein PHS99_03940 [Candidatus Marinimicrobia bacterium]|nr:hypothetical protein [Candidatus Neomarinimicrobiota bacterium]
MKFKKIYALLLLTSLLSPLYGVSLRYAQKLTNYHSFRYLYSMSQSQDKTYFATDNGAIVYSHIFRCWERPMNYPQGLLDKNIKTIYYHPATGYLWAAADQALYVLFGDAAFQWEKIDFFGTCRRIGSDNNRLFAETYSQVLELDPYTGSVIHPVNPENFSITWSVSSIKMDLYQVQFTGQYFIDVDGSSVVESAFRKYPISFSVYGNNQNLWMGTLGNGLYTGDRSTLFVQHMPYGLLNNNVTRCDVFGNKVFIGHGIDYKGPDDRNGWTETHTEFQNFRWIDEDDVPVLGNQTVRGFLYYQDTLLVITDHSIIVERPQKNDFMTITPGVGLINTVQDVVQCDTMAWIIAESGIFKINIKELSISPVLDIPIQIQTAIFMDGYLYLGSHFGILVYEVSDSSTLIFKKDFINVYYGVQNLAENGKNIFWSDDFSIRKADPYLNNLTTLPVTDLRRGIYINDIACDTAYIWVGTNQGLFSFNLATEQTEHITMNEGLCSNRIQTLEISDNILYIGTDQGLTRYEIND